LSAIFHATVATESVNKFTLSESTVSNFDKFW